METQIIAQNLSKWYREIRGVSGINLEVGPGITGLIGPNGAGKTTLLNLMCGFLEPSHGYVNILGEPAFSGKKFRRYLGVVSQKEAVYPHMTVLDFVSIMTQLHGFNAKESRERANAAIEKVQLSHKKNQRIYSLSKGMRQCLKLAQAIAHDPQILLLDELFTGCDPLVKHQIKILLSNMANNGATIILSSHNLKEMEALTDEVIIIHCGKIAAHGKISTLQNNIRNDHRLFLEGRNLRPLGQALLQYSDILSIELPNENSLIVQTSDSKAFYQRLPKLLSEGQFWVEKILSQDQDLQALFRNLVQGI